MDSKELRGLMEAYTDVYAPQEEIEEATYSAKAARAGKDIGKPGKEFAKIAKEAGKRYGSKERGEKVAGAVLAKLRKQHEEVEIDEAVKGADPEMRRAASAERRAGDKRLSPSKGKGYAAHAMQQAAYVDKKTKGKHIPGYAYAEELDIFDVVLEFLQVEGYAETLEEAEWLMANVINEEAIGIILEVLDTPEKANEYARKNVRSMLGAFAKGVVNKDISQLKTINKRKRGAELGKRKAERKAVEEEYVDEAQAARENPEKYEADQKKKYAPVRGERTPMPPRGDKRREDFEKWYRANVR